MSCHSRESKQEENKMEKSTQRKINSEITKMLRAYEALIADPAGKIKKWRTYGNFSTCRMCRLMLNNSEQKYPNPEQCAGCPIAVRGGFASCSHSYTYNAFEEAIGDYFFYDYYGTDATVLHTARKRYEWLINTLEVNGYDYK